MTLSIRARTRLLRLADKLDGSGPYASVGPVPSEEFTMSTWGNGCGTAGCAIGHACRDEWFTERGLYLNMTDGQAFPRYEHTNTSASKTMAQIAEFFDIPHAHASSLFGVRLQRHRWPNKWNHTPSEIAAAIRAYVWVVTR